MDMEIDRAKAVELLVAAQTGDMKRARGLLPPCGDGAEDGAVAAPGGVTPLMAAAAGGHEPMVELLLRCGADPARRDPRGRSAAFHARAAGHPHLAARLDTVVDQEKTIW
jgi:ankyrin repeat protein